jgi:hypothetical protein
MKATCSGAYFKDSYPAKKVSKTNNDRIPRTRKGQGNINQLVRKKIREYFGPGIAYSVQVTGWMTKESWFYFQRMQEVYLL